ISKPIAGFIGLIDHWFDVPLMSKVAKRLPDISFVMVGDTRVDVQSLEALPNVHLVGRKPYADLPAYCAAFDLGLIPFVRNHLTDNVNPIKLREYLAAGLPVVSTNLPEVRRYEEFVLLTDDAETFAAHCRSAIDRDTITNRRKRSDAVAVESWESVTNRIRQIVCDAKCATAKPACDQPSQSIAPA
ncbi:MAG: glycosyltransferase family 1 protein, partial [Planctomycetes bacterium]|nr:glycosyltransferase family 1 protein [Planctomycetota bacterium]